MEPDIELLLDEDDDVMGLFLGRHKATVHQAYGYVIQNEEALPKLSFRKEFGSLFRISTVETFSCPTTFLALTNHTGKSNTPLRRHAEAVGQVRPA